MTHPARRSLSSFLVPFALVLVLMATGACSSPSFSISPTSAPASPATKEPTKAAAATTGSTYKIGFVTSVTGAASYLGEPERDSALMLQKQLDAQGGIKGPDGVMHPVRILVQDTQGSADVAVPVTKKLIDTENVVAVIGPATSGEAMALIPIVQEAQVPLIAMASSSGIVKPVAERKWVFKVAQSNEHTAPWQVKYAKAKGLTQVASVYASGAYGEDGAAAIRDTAKAEGVQIVLEDSFGAADTDMTALITKIKASPAQAVLVTAIPPAAAIFTKQFRELGLTLPLIHNSGIGQKQFIDLAGAAAAEGVIFPIGKIVATDALPDNDPQKPVLKQFIADFQQNVGKPPSQFAAHAADSVQIVVNVLKTFNEGLSIQDQRAKLRDGIENTKGYAGLDGMFNFSATDHVGLSQNDVVLVRISGGNWSYFPQDKW
jgi:branched-chain amino acid transport system substrate-binding protein